MGCFNVQCVASKINIFSEDEMVVFPLISSKNNTYINFDINLQQIFDSQSPQKQDFLIKDPLFQNLEKVHNVKVPKEGHFLVHDSEWNLGFPFMAQYDEYGGFTLNKEQESQLAIKKLIQLVKIYGVAVDKKNYEYWSESFNPENLNTENIKASIEKIYDMVREDAMLLLNKHGETAGLYAGNYQYLTFAYMDKKVYDLILSKSEKILNDNYEKIQEYINTYPEFCKLESEYFKSYSSESKLSEEEKENLLEKYAHEKNKYSRVGALRESDSDFPLYFVYRLITNAAKYISSNEDKTEFFWEEGKKEQFYQLLKAKAELYVVNNYMKHTLWQKWSPVQHTGQEYTNRNRIEFNKEVNLIAMQKSNEIDNYQEELNALLDKKKKRKL